MPGEALGVHLGRWRRRGVGTPVGPWQWEPKVGWTQAGALCPVLPRDLFALHPEEGNMWALPSCPPGPTGTRPPAAVPMVSCGPQSTSPSPDPQSRVQGQDGGRVFSLGKRRTLGPRCEADGAGGEKAENQCGDRCGKHRSPGLNGGTILYGCLRMSSINLAEKFCSV